MYSLFISYEWIFMFYVHNIVDIIAFFSKIKCLVLWCTTTAATGGSGINSKVWWGKNALTDLVTSEFNSINWEPHDHFYAENGLKRAHFSFHNQTFDRLQWLNQQLKIITEKQATGWDSAIYHFKTIPALKR